MQICSTSVFKHVFPWHAYPQEQNQTETYVMEKSWMLACVRIITHVYVYSAQELQTKSQGI